MKFETTIIGRVGRDPETRQVGDKKVTSFSVATNPYKDKTVWVKVSSWGKRAEIDEKFVRKGMLVMCVGTLQSDDSGNPRTYEKDGQTKSAGFELTANQVLYLSKISASEEQSQPVTLDLGTDEIPF